MKKNYLQKFFQAGIFYCLLGIPVLLAGQQRLIKGNVISQSGGPLAGVTVLVRNTKVGTTTDVKGDFQINVPPGRDTLEFRYLGYIPLEVGINGHRFISVQLSPLNERMNEFVVVGYGRKKKLDLTGAVDQIGNEYFQNRPVPNASRALEGAIPNLNINFTNGRPNTNPEYNIRGLTSIGAGGSALVLIDGVPGDPSTLNPNDITSVSVLKDAASAAIYGSRGAFGVVLITTKKPQKSKSQITISESYSIGQRTVTPDLVTDGYTWAKMFDESYRSWTNYTASASTIGSSGLSFSSSYLDSLKFRSEHPGLLPSIGIDPATKNYVYYGNTDWFKELYANSIPSMQHSLDASGGNDKVGYLISGSYYRQGGLYKIRSDKYNRYNLRAEGDIHITDWLTITDNTVFSSYNYTDPFNGTNIWLLLNGKGDAAPMAIMYNPDGTLTRTAALGVGALLGGSQSIEKQRFIQNNIAFDASLIKNVLSIKGNFSYQNTNYETDNKSVPIQYSVKPGQISELGVSELSSTIQNNDYYAYNLYSNYANTFGNHHLEVLLGGNMEISKQKNLSVSRDNLLIPELSDFNVAVGQNTEIAGGGNEWADIGFFSRINYNYKEKYLIEVNGRYDGSSKFPQSQQFAFFPSISFGWRISQEPFMKRTRSWLNNFKLRGSYGSLGNSQISPYLYLQQLRAKISPVIIKGIYPAFIQNPVVLPDNFTWETSTTSDIGIDMDLFNGKVNASFDWYQRRTINMITSGPVLPAVFGASPPKGNYANLSTKGFELSIGWKGQVNMTHSLHYSLRFTLANNVAYITKFNNPTGLLAIDPYNFVTGYYVGQRVGDIWGYVTEGLFTSEDDIKSHADQGAVQVSAANVILPGDIKFKDLNHDDKIDKGKETLQDHGDLKIIGNSQPRFPFGLTANLDWNNFSLSAFFQGIGKRDWYPNFGATDFWGQYSTWYFTIPKNTLKNNWTLDGNNPDSYWPRYRGPMPYGDRELQAQTRYLQNASYIRLKSITISYTLPKQLIKRTKLMKVQIYLSGNNIWTYSPMYKITRNIDPEMIDPSAGAYGTLDYPMLKTYTIGFNLTF